MHPCLRTRVTAGATAVLTALVLLFAPTAAQADPELTITETSTGEGTKPHSLAVVPAGPGAGTVWVTDEANGTVSAYDPDTRSLEATVQLDADAKPHGVIAGSDGSVWVAGWGNGMVYKISDAASAHRTVEHVHIGSSPAYLTFSADRSTVWVDTAGLINVDPTGNSGLYGIRASGPLNSGAIVASHSLGISGAQRLIAGPDGRIWVAIQTHSVVAYTPQTGEQVNYLGEPAQYVGITTDGVDMLVTDANLTVSHVVKVSTGGEEIDAVSLPGNSVPTDMVIAPDPATGKRTLFVALQGQSGVPGGVARIDLNTFTLIDTLALPTGDAAPHSIAYLPATTTLWGTEPRTGRLFHIGAASTAPTPTATALSPQHGPTVGGTAVTITGTDLEQVSGVTFDGVPATDNTVSRDGDALTVTTPAHDAGTVDVVLTASSGSITLPAAYTYDPETTPTPQPDPTEPSGPDTTTGTGSHGSGVGPAVPGLSVNTGGTTVGADRRIPVRAGIDLVVTSLTATTAPLHRHGRSR